ncbi:hypothetical protein [Pseudomonas sp. C2B4]|uniref:hypothetical protein n=1 Tax=Pseudomonas sp. C2B4 TaxID=2735270 RepID=UPI001586EAFC|nr:hypothetical protein [Pseudomonas sp. C2B4]NUU35124.1 hypothetical protein [Pseudomonas sp. C2B4]
MDFNKKLAAQKARRQGPSVSTEMFDSVHYAEASTRALYKSQIFESLQESNGVKWVLWAMDPVEKEYTEISKSEGERIALSLVKSLEREGVKVEARLQGSVGLDIHIKGVSDVDMLIVVKSTILVQQPPVVAGLYPPPTDKRPMVDIVADLRARSEVILKANFPAATVDISGAKAIALEGGSLVREIDIVPAAWYHTTAYQKSQMEFDKGIQIYNKKEHVLHVNFPFLNRQLINDADARSNGILKGVIRLMKTMISDMDDERKALAKGLNSFDLSAIAYDMREELEMPAYLRLGALEKLREHLWRLVVNSELRDNLIVPDGTRKVFDNESKVPALAALYLECEDLAKSVHDELMPFGNEYKGDVLLNKVVSLVGQWS